MITDVEVDQLQGGLAGPPGMHTHEFITADPPSFLGIISVGNEWPRAGSVIALGRQPASDYDHCVAAGCYLGTCPQHIGHPAAMTGSLPKRC